MKHPHSVRALLALSMLIMPACGGDSNGPGESQLHVAGTYETVVTLESSSCGSVNVQAAPTVVTHTPGALTLSLQHAGNTYTGDIETNGSFATTPLVLNQETATFTISILGQFAVTGFEAQVTVQVEQQTEPNSCEYVVRWNGTRTSGSNMIPG